MSENGTTIKQDLLDKVQALKALSTVHSLLNLGMFQVGHTQVVKESISFVESLHKQVMDEALSHPDSELVEELNSFRPEGQVENGK